MTLKQKLKNPFVQQYVLEIALPLAGYFLFDWSIAVIITFYFIDYLASEVARHRRHYKIMRHDSKANQTMFGLAVGMSIIFFSVSLAWTLWNSLLMSQGKNTNYLEEMSTFFTDEGWFLMPIVYLAYHLKDTMTFYMSRKFTQYDFNLTIKYYLIEIMCMFGLIMSGIYCWMQFDIPDIPALFGFIAIKLAFDFGLAHRIRLKSLK